MSNPISIRDEVRSAPLPISATRLLMIRFALVAGFALATALSAQVYIPLPNTPVPITLQTFVVLSAALCLGGGYGALSMGLYLALGSVGYEFFHGGEWGLKTLIGPTGGYLIGFVVAQPLVGYLATRDARAGRITLALLAGYAVIFAFGVSWLKLWLEQSWAVAISQGLVPFLPGMAIKLAGALGVGLTLAPRLRRWFT